MRNDITTATYKWKQCHYKIILKLVLATFQEILSFSSSTYVPLAYLPIPVGSVLNICIHGDHSACITSRYLAFIQAEARYSEKPLQVLQEKTDMINTHEGFLSFQTTKYRHDMFLGCCCQCSCPPRECTTLRTPYLPGIIQHTETVF